MKSYNYISVIPNGGVPPYKYSWKGPNNFTSSYQTIENSQSGKYTVIVTDSNEYNLELPTNFLKYNCIFKNHKDPVVEENFDY